MHKIRVGCHGRGMVCHTGTRVGDMFFEFQRLIRIAALGWWNDRAMSLGASISFFTVFSLAPMLLAAISVAGLAFGHDAAQGAVVGELGGLLGEEAAKALEAMIVSARDIGSGIIGTTVGVLSRPAGRLVPGLRASNESVVILFVVSSLGRVVRRCWRPLILTRLTMLARLRHSFPFREQTSASWSERTSSSIFDDAERAASSFTGLGTAIESGVLTGIICCLLSELHRINSI